MAFHSKQRPGAGGVHVAHAYEFADAAAMSSAVLVALDVGKIARRLDTGDFYILRSVAPTLWDLLGLPAAVGSYTHVQASASTSWVVNHNLGFEPSIQVRNTGGVVVGCRVQHVSLNQAVISFNVATAGSARAN
jgi:hypothetical protein